MSSNPCNSGAMKNLLSSLQGASTYARSEAYQIASVAREARSVAVSDNSIRPNFVTATLDALGLGAALGSSSAGPHASPPSTKVGSEGTVGRALSASGALIQGLRNRLFLKYAGIDYEFYNVYDMRYRGGP